MSNSPPATTGRPRFIRLQFSLRTLMLVTLVLGPPAAYLSNFAIHVRRQRAIVVKIDELCGSVIYEHQQNARNPQDAPPPGPAFMRWLFGNDAYMHVCHVFVGADLNRFFGTGLTSWENSDLSILAGLPRLQELTVVKLSVNDKGMRCISRVRSLRRLNLEGPQISREGVAQLRHNRQLEYLGLDGPGITDETLRGLRELKGLKHLVLHDTAITSAAVKNLEHLTELQTLEIDPASEIDDEALKSLAKLPNLTTLEIGHSKVTYQGLAFLAGHQRLTELILRSSEITDAGMPYLLELPSLRKLDLSHTKITNAGLPTLAKISTLVELDLRGNGLGRKSKDFFRDHAKLQTLKLF